MSGILLNTVEFILYKLYFPTNVAVLDPMYANTRTADFILEADGTNLNPFGLSRGIESYKNRVWTRVEQLGKKLQLQCGERVGANHHGRFPFSYISR